MPRLWTETIEGHRAAVHDAVLDATATLVRGHGLSAVTMAAIARTTGIGRATLYKYFPDVDAILAAWHQRHVAEHVRQLSAEAAGVADPAKRLATVLAAYARLSGGPGGNAPVFHAADHVQRSKREVRDFVGHIIEDAQRAGAVRTDVPADELAAYAIAALDGAATVRGPAAIGRLVAVTLSGLTSKGP